MGQDLPKELIIIIFALMLLFALSFLYAVVKDVHDNPPTPESKHRDFCAEQSYYNGISGTPADCFDYSPDGGIIKFHGEGGTIW